MSTRELPLSQRGRTGLHEVEHDLIAIGCGPFNLGLAALASTAAVDLLVLEAEPALTWHPGLMFDDALLQQSFLADLVTLIDPTHPLSFLAYLRSVDRLYPFFIRESFHPTRREYEDYLRWAVQQLPSLRFGHRVESVRWDERRARFLLEVSTPAGPLHEVARDLVIGIGTEPRLPEAFAHLPEERLFHSSQYLRRTSQVERASHITVLGSGQSAAEIVLDLLRRNLHGGPAFSWLTRTPSFAPLDYSKLVLEMTTPAYVHYFHGLPQTKKDQLNREQWRHYKGISTPTIDAIHELLYQREVNGRAHSAPVELCCGVSANAARVEGDALRLSLRHADSGREFELRTSLLIAATGYRERRPAFLAALEPAIGRDATGRARVRRDYSLELATNISGRIFVANAELHTHGVATPDLGVAAYRNATILNHVSGRELYRLPQRSAFTTFGLPELGRVSEASRELERSHAMRAGARDPHSIEAES